MASVVVKRIVLGIPTLIGVTILLFVTLRLLPGDPVTILTSGAPTTPEVRAELRDQFNLDEPIVVQWFHYATDALRLDFGTSFTTRQPVGDMIADQIWPTIQLAAAAALVSATVGIVAGTLAAMFRDTWFDGGIRVVSLVNTAMPSFWAGLLLIMTFSFRFELFPATGSDGLSSLVLPAITLGLAAAGTVTRLVRNSVLEAQGENFVTALHAKGLASRQIMGKHVLRNAVIPTVTVVGYQLGALLAGAVIVETVFARQGIGRMLTQAVQGKDYPVVQGIVLVIATAYIAINIVVDVSYSYIDPRVREPVTA